MQWVKVERILAWKNGSCRLMIGRADFLSNHGYALAFKLLLPQVGGTVVSKGHEHVASDVPLISQTSGRLWSRHPTSSTVNGSPSILSVVVAPFGRSAFSTHSLIRWYVRAIFADHVTSWVPVLMS